MTDPLQNPRPVWRLHYDHRTRAGRWGRFLARMLRLRTSGDRYMAELRMPVK
jgi:hypothetical protein